ncbi:MAG: hypothetical protein D6736_17660 [Nitrospinota bacterium]|nr:MAG: hypothetical protein D6736_17660 [Nitrospinota bacterium]
MREIPGKRRESSREQEQWQEREGKYVLAYRVEQPEAYRSSIAQGPEVSIGVAGGSGTWQVRSLEFPKSQGWTLEMAQDWYETYQVEVIPYQGRHRLIPIPILVDILEVKEQRGFLWCALQGEERRTTVAEVLRGRLPWAETDRGILPFPFARPRAQVTEAAFQQCVAQWTPEEKPWPERVLLFFEHVAYCYIWEQLRSLCYEVGDVGPYPLSQITFSPAPARCKTDPTWLDQQLAGIEEVISHAIALSARSPEEDDEGDDRGGLVQAAVYHVIRDMGIGAGGQLGLGKAAAQWFGAWIGTMITGAGQEGLVQEIQAIAQQALPAQWKDALFLPSRWLWYRMGVGAVVQWLRGWEQTGYQRRQGGQWV